MTTPPPPPEPPTSVPPASPTPEHVEQAARPPSLIMCAVQNRLLAKFDPARLSPGRRAELLAAVHASEGKLFLFCKHCRAEHAVDFLRLLTSEEEVLWVGARPRVPRPPGALGPSRAKEEERRRPREEPPQEGGASS